MNENGSLEVTKLTLADYDDCLDFLNLVFSQQNGHPIDFERELPKAFRRDEQLVNRHWACRRHGRIRAIVGVYPMTLRVGDRQISCATVGNVATHADERGNGLMKLLMREAMQELNERQIDLSRLGGERLRYNRYGYEQAGRRYRQVMTRKNALSFGDPAREDSLVFRPLTLDDRPLLEAAFQLHRNQPVAVDRPDPVEFDCALRAHVMQPWAVLDPQGRLVGYLTASADHRTINEQQVANGLLLPNLLFAWIRHWQLDSVTYWLLPWDNQALQDVGPYRETAQIESPSMFLIRNWPRLIAAFLRLKLQTVDLPVGELLIRIGGGDTLTIRVEDGQAACSVTPGRPADLELDQLTATRLIFGTLPAETILALPRRISCIVQAWFPLPLSWPLQDNV